MMLFTRSAVPIELLSIMLLKPKPETALLGSPIEFAAALMRLLKSARSCTAGATAAAAIGMRTRPVTSIVYSSSDRQAGGNLPSYQCS